MADVSPGDMLIVPPFWFHHVETLSESVSVNVWSDAPEYVLLNEMWASYVTRTHAHVIAISHVYHTHACVGSL